MGNYFGSLPYINSGYKVENNNMVDTDIAVHVEEPRELGKSSYFNVVDAPTVLAVNKLQHECKKDSSVIMKIWHRLNNFYTTPFAPYATNLIEESSKVISSERNRQINSVTPTKKNSWNKERAAESDLCISFRSNSQRPPKDCLKYTTPPDSTNVSEENSQFTSVKAASERFWKNECETDDFINIIFNSKRYQRPQAQDYVELSQDRPLKNFIFQRLDSGIEDSPYPCRTRTQIDLNSAHLTDNCFEDPSYHYRTRTQIDLDSLYLTTMIRTVDSQEFCFVSENLLCGTGRSQGYHKSISFFIDIRDPLKQKPLGDEYKFSACSECDSMFSDKFSQSSNEDYLDDDFIFFEESSSEKEDSYGFNFTLNTCTPTELSCSVGTNSSVTTYFDISTDSSLCGNTSCNENPRKPNKESIVSVKIDIFPDGNEKTQHESRLRNNNSSNASGCVNLKDFSAHEITSEINTCISSLKSSFTVCTTKEKQPTIFSNSNSSSTGGECTLVQPNCTNEVTNQNITSSFDVYKTKKKKSKKKVCFEEEDDLVVIHQMRHWDFAYREARKGTWELAAVDRCRFWRRIKELELILSPCLRRKLKLIENT